MSLRTFFFILLAILLIGAWLNRNSRSNRLHEYWIRSCQGRAWKHRFPKANKADIRTFLAMFADSFLVNQAQRLQFSPDDRQMDIYHILYPSKFMADTLELELFALEFKKLYHIDLVPLWRADITLGELFELSQRA